MSLAVADYSGQAWLQGFNDVGVAIFGMSANELLEIRVSFSFLVKESFISTLLSKGSLSFRVQRDHAQGQL